MCKTNCCVLYCDEVRCTAPTLFLWLTNAKVMILPYWQLGKACSLIRFWLWVSLTRFLAFVSTCVSDRKHSLLEHRQVAKAVVARLGTLSAVPSHFYPITRYLVQPSFMKSIVLFYLVHVTQLVTTFSLLQWIQQSLSPLAMIFLKKVLLNLNFDLMKAYTLL